MGAELRFNKEPPGRRSPHDTHNNTVTLAVHVCDEKMESAYPTVLIHVWKNLKSNKRLRVGCKNNTSIIILPGFTTFMQFH